MKKKHYLTLDNDFISYCKLNNIDDIEGYAVKIFNDAFLRIKYPQPKIKNVRPEPIQQLEERTETIKKESNLYDE